MQLLTSPLSQGAIRAAGANGGLAANSRGPKFAQQTLGLIHAAHGSMRVAALAVHVAVGDLFLAGLAHFDDLDVEF